MKTNIAELAKRLDAFQETYHQGLSALNTINERIAALERKTVPESAKQSDLDSLSDCYHGLVESFCSVSRRMDLLEAVTPGHALPRVKKDADKDNAAALAACFSANPDLEIIVRLRAV